MKRFLILFSLMMAVCSAAAADVNVNYFSGQTDGVQVTSEFIDESKPVNPWQAMEQKEREYRSEITRLNRAAEARRSDHTAVKPTPAVMVRGNRLVTVKTMDSVAIPDYSYTPEPKEEKKSSLSGPSMGFKGGHKLRTFYAGSDHFNTWKYAPNQTRME